jgi:hypothetical protein
LRRPDSAQPLTQTQHSARGGLRKAQRACLRFRCLPLESLSESDPEPLLSLSLPEELPLLPPLSLLLVSSEPLLPLDPEPLLLLVLVLDVSSLPLPLLLLSSDEEEDVSDDDGDGVRLRRFLSCLCLRLSLSSAATAACNRTSSSFERNSSGISSAAMKRCLDCGRDVTGKPAHTRGEPAAHTRGTRPARQAWSGAAAGPPPVQLSQHDQG